MDDKIRTKELLGAGGVPVPATLGIVDSYVRVEEIIEDISRHPGIVINPSKGKAGGGILLLEKSSSGEWRIPSGRKVTKTDLLYHVGEILFGVYSFGSTDDRALFEEKIVPDRFFLDIYADGVADIRVILFRKTPILAMARIPTSHSDGKANLHQGAIGAGIDLESGELLRVSRRGKIISTHPDTDKPIMGLRIPGWKEILDVVVRAGGCVDLEYLGVDLVIDQNAGPLVLELNARPGLEIQVANGVCLGELLRKQL